MTAEEAIGAARAVAADRGWPWVEPAWAAVRRGGLLGLGRRSWEVVSNARSNRDYVRVRIEDRSGRVLNSDYVQTGAPDGPTVTEFRAIEIARQRAAQEGWTWKEPAVAVLMRPTRGGLRHWWVRAPGNVVGHSVSVVIEGTTGEVLQAGVMPR